MMQLQYATWEMKASFLAPSKAANFRTALQKGVVKHQLRDLVLTTCCCPSNFALTVFVI